MWSSRSVDDDRVERRAPVSEYVRVRVVGDPKGGVPAWIREAWLGVEFDAHPVRRPILVGGPWWKRRTPRSGWIVPAAEALDALRAAGRSDAVAWWEQSGYVANELQILVFAQASCEQVGR